MTIAYPPEKCDLCGGDLKSGETYYDFRVPYRHVWGWGCKDCFENQQGKLGTGNGQEYDSATNEKLRG